MKSITHFEIMADDLERAKQFYSEAFGWQYEDYSEYTSSPYWGIIAKEEGADGINGGLMERDEALSHAGEGTGAFICTIVVDDYDQAAKKILSLGGKERKAKYALPGMAWQGYFEDTEGNLFGIHQADENAK